MTIIVNFYGSSGSGKSTKSLELTTYFKKLGINVEYVSEYAKDLVYQNNHSLLQKPFSIFAKQKEKIDILLDHNIDLIITDSPLILTSFYGLKYGCADSKFEDIVLHEFNKYSNINFFINRDVPFLETGRIQKEEESDQDSIVLYNYLNKLKIKYTEINSTSLIDTIIPLIPLKEII